MTEFGLKRVIPKQIAKTELLQILTKLSNIFGNDIGEANDFTPLFKLFHSCGQWQKIC